MQIQGYNLDALGPLGQPRDKWHIDEHGIACSTMILCLYADWPSVIPALYAAHALNLGCLYVGAEVEQEQEFGELCLVTLKYNQRYYQPPSDTPLPQPQFGVNGTKVVEDITLHPNFSAASNMGFPPDVNSPWSQFWDSRKKDWNSDDNTGQYLNTVPAYLIGWTKFPDAGATVWTKVYYTSQPTDPLPQGRIVDPGFGFGPSGCYLVNTCDQQKENAFWYRLTHFDYFPRGVPTKIFSKP